MIRVPGKPHLSQFYGSWQLNYQPSDNEEWVNKAFSWVSSKNLEKLLSQITEIKPFGKLDIRYNPDRHGAIR